MRKLRIGGGTINTIPLDWHNNLEKIISVIREAKNQNVELLCFPELCISGYGCEDLFVSNWVPEKSIKKLLELLPHTEGIGVVVGLPVRIENITYNASCFIIDQEIQGFYAKQNLANGGIYYEPRWFKPWPAGIISSLTIEDVEYPFGELIFNFKDLKIGLEICEDIWVKERPACRYVEKGIDLILNSSASHFSFGKSMERQDLVIDSSSLFNCSYLYVNLLGNESGQIIFDGDIILAQKGKLIQKGQTFGFDNFRLLSYELNFDDDANSISKVKKEKNQEFLEGESLAFFDYLRKSRNRGFVVSLSGGADSALCVVLVFEMIKSALAHFGITDFLKNINRNDLLDDANQKSNSEILPFLVNKLLIVAYQATVNSSELTFKAAKELAESLGAQFYYWKVDEAIEFYRKTIEDNIGRSLSWENDDVVLQNIQARSRSPVIWMLANLNSYLLLVTSNRSEASTGYATMDGDTSGSLAPIAGISKTFIRQWLIWAEENLGHKGLHAINSLVPTAELRPLTEQQTDEGDLMPYPLLQEIEGRAIYLKMSPVEIYLELKDKLDFKPEEISNSIAKFFRLLAASQWKRERFAPTFHLDDYNVNPRSWYRFPVLSSAFEDELEELEKMTKQSSQH